MRKNISQNPTVYLDLSNHSTADIMMQTSQRYQCGICKKSNSSQELVDLCKCEDPVHETCMSQLIDDWIQSVGTKPKQNNLQNKKLFTCIQCQGEVFYKTKNELFCRTLTGILMIVKKYPVKSFFQIIFFLIGMGSLILGILIKLEKVTFETSINPLTLSIIAIASIICSSLMTLISFYYILVDIFTEKREKVDKIYQRIKKERRKTSQTIPVINLKSNQ